MSTTVLVTGANGQLASCIKDIESSFSELNLIYTDYLELDICDKKQVTIFFKENSPVQYCINCAAYTAVDEAETDVNKAFENLAQSCADNNTVLIQISTDFIFDGKKALPYLETDTPCPISIYGKSKLAGENEILKVMDNYFIIRTSWLYSEHGNNFFKTMRELAKNKDELSIVNDQIGSPTYAKDLAQVVLKIIENKYNTYGIYNYCNQGQASWYDFATAIFEFSNINIKLNPVPSEAYLTKAKRPSFSVLDTTKITNTLHLEIPSWKDSLKKAITYLK